MNQDDKTKRQVADILKRMAVMEKTIKQLSVQNRQLVTLTKRQRTQIDRLEDQVQAILSRG